MVLGLTHEHDYPWAFVGRFYAFFVEHKIPTRYGIKLKDVQYAAIHGHFFLFNFTLMPKVLQSLGNKL